MTGRSSAKRSKLVKLKQWLTVSEAAEYLALVFDEDVTESDVYQLALDGNLKLSVRFVNGAFVRPENSGPTEAEEERVHLEGVWDLPMSGAEKLDVERAYQELIGGPDVDMLYRALGERFVESSDGVQFVVLRASHEGGRTQFFDAFCLPVDSVFVVRTKALEKLLQQAPDAPLDRKLRTRERDTLLTIIGALCNEARLDVNHPSKAAGIIESLTTRLGARVSSRTVENHLKLIPDVLAKKRE